MLIVRRDAVRLDRPSWPGGGTVNFVSPWDHDYVADLSAREEAGTPNVVGDIRAALASLPQGRTPTQKDWEKISRTFRAHLDDRISRMTRLRDSGI